MKNIIIKPLITEKAMKDSSTGKYIFEANPSANSAEIAQAIENIFQVNVRKINIIRVKGKVKVDRKSRIPHQRKNWKKAIVTLAKGQIIKDLQIKEEKKNKKEKEVEKDAKK